VDVEEARELARQDPAIKAGWFEVVVDRWLVRAVPQTGGPVSTSSSSLRW
jgi:hypothetical protein